jgi:hypothetical protein
LLGCYAEDGGFVAIDLYVNLWAIKQPIRADVRDVPAPRGSFLDLWPDLAKRLR